MTFAADRRLVVDAAMRSDLYAFLQAIFPVVSAGSELVLNWHLEAITSALTDVIRGKTRRLIITVPPRSLKSICASVALPAFVLGHDPTRRLICVSYSEGLARKHANDCRALMRSSLYRRLFPAARISSSKDTEVEVMTTAGGFRLATSVGGTLTGRGGNFIIIDDPMCRRTPNRKRRGRMFGSGIRTRCCRVSITRSLIPLSWSCSACTLKTSSDA
jgi:hypothetical protein